MSSARQANGAASAGGFTLVELLVVIGIVGVLLAVALPVLNGTLESGRQANEMSAARQLMLAHTSYSADHRDALFPGYLHGLRARNGVGEPIGGEPAARYPWRIAPYINYDMYGLYKNTHEAVLQKMQQEETTPGASTYVVSLVPSLGINGQWVGGDENESSFNPTAIRAYGRFCATAMSEVRRADKLLVFVSARGIDPLDPEVETNLLVEGYFKVLSPRFRKAGAPRWSETFEPAGSPADFGYVSLRYGEGAVTAFVDGHVDLLEESELRDMRHWANHADAPDYGVQVQP